MFNSLYKKTPYAVFILLIQSFFALWAVSRAGHFSTRNIFTPILFTSFFLYFKYISQLRIKKINIFTKHIAMIVLAVSFLFTLLFLLAGSSSLTGNLDNRFFQLIVLAACGTGFFFLVYDALSLLFLSAVPYTLPPSRKTLRHMPLFSFFICLLCWFPYFLYEYPAIMTPDSINQFEQILHMIPYSNHHPWAHTMTIKALYSIGFFFTKDINASLAFFTFFQMCFMSGCIAWMIAALQKLKTKNAVCFFIIAFYALIPYHAVFAVTIWKDVMFSGAVLLFTTALTRLFFFSKTEGSPADGPRQHTASCIIYILSGIMICLFRSNGWYAFLFSAPFLIYAFRRQLKTTLFLHFTILTVALIVKIPLMNMAQVAQPDFIESICIPLQQTARVICEGKELTPKQWASIHKVIDTTYIKDLYAPGFADNMKELVRAGHPEYLTQHKGEYLMLWLSLGLKYPGAYLQAYIDQTVGYWYPDVAYTVGDIDGIIPSATGAESHPLIGGPFVVKTKEILQKLGDMLPLYGLLFSMGSMFWAFILAIAIVCAKKQYNRCILFLPGAALILTLLIATPVSSEFRYAYPLAYALPLYLLLPFFPSPSREPGL